MDKSYATIIIPYIDGMPDIDQYNSQGIRVFAGKLTEAQLLGICEDTSYPKRSTASFYDGDGNLSGLQVTFSNDENAEPEVIDEICGEMGSSIKGYEYNDATGCGDLMIVAKYVVLETAPVQAG